MAKWELDCSNGEGVVTQSARPGEIRVVNYIADMGEDGNWVIKHRIEQFWDGKWGEIKVYHDPGNGALQRITQ